MTPIELREAMIDASLILVFLKESQEMAYELL